MAGGPRLLEAAANRRTDDRIEDMRPRDDSNLVKKHGGADLHEYVQGVAGLVTRIAVQERSVLIQSTSWT
jgi:hypothetical protein